MTDPCTFVIFGATGNLAGNKLLPALYELENAGRLPSRLAIVGFGRREWSTEDWRRELGDQLAGRYPDGVNNDAYRGLCDRMHYYCGDMTDADSLQGLREFLQDGDNLPQNMVFYMAIPPSQYARVSHGLAQAGLSQEENGWRRLVIEKPFGYDIESAQILEGQLHRDFAERQIFRIDHYLGKGMVQNVMVFRFANLMMEPLWNRNYIDHVQITHSETQGIAGRASYYDTAGALRDMIQSHLLQLLTLVAMEPPANLDAESLRDEKVKVLKSIRPIPRSAVHAHAFRAQYAAGTVTGERMRGYTDEDGVAANSTTETYASLKLYLDNWRWRDVPFYLRTGKAMAQNSSLIAIRFKHPPQQLFRKTPIDKIKPNWLLLSIQPLECLRMEMQVKTPGLELQAETTRLDASHCRTGDYQIDAYEGLLLDIIENDRSLFLRYDEIRLAWEVVDPILKVWSTERDYIHTYTAGSWGPKEDDRLFDRDDHEWRNSFESED